jgi:outer membrane protein TolC
VPAPALSIGFELHWPVEHTAARALLLSRSALHQQSLIRLRDVQRGVAPAISTVASAILRLAARYDETTSAAARYATSVQNEQVKRRLGISTLIDVLNVQDRLDAAQLELLQLRQDYAVQLGQLLFEFGALVRRNPTGFDIEVPALQGTRPFQVGS